MEIHKCLCCGASLKDVGFHDGVNEYEYFKSNYQISGIDEDYHVVGPYLGKPVKIIEDNVYPNKLLYCNSCNSLLGEIKSMEKFLNMVVIPF